MSALPVFLDTDIGTDVDDAVALALAARSPEIDLLGVGTVFGDAPLRAEIARTVLGLAGSTDTPVAAGCGPTLRGRTPTRAMLGHEGKGILGRGTQRAPAYRGSAVDLLLDVASHSAARVTVIAIGPLTNIARALTREPSITSRIDRLLVMGGSVHPETFNEATGHRLRPVVVRLMESNLNADPAAARVVFGSAVPITLIPAEITFRVFFTEDDLRALRHSHGDLGRTLAEAVDIWVPVLRKTLSGIGGIAQPVLRLLLGDFTELPRPYLHDPLTVASSFTEGLVRLESRHLRLERRFGVLQTLADPDREPNAQIAVSVDPVATRQLIIERLTG